MLKTRVTWLSNVNLLFFFIFLVRRISYLEKLGEITILCWIIRVSEAPH